MTLAFTRDDVRHITLPQDAVDDLIDGYLHVVTHYGEGWGVGLLPPYAGAEDRSIAAGLRLSGVAVLQLQDAELTALHQRRPVRRTDSTGTRYLLTAQSVDDGEPISRDED